MHRFLKIPVPIFLDLFLEPIFSPFFLPGFYGSVSFFALENLDKNRKFSAILVMEILNLQSENCAETRM